MGTEEGQQATLGTSLAPLPASFNPKLSLLLFFSYGLLHSYQAAAGVPLLLSFTP